jgi:acetyltransferase-like isoleucine patch superfamily enzyme
VKQLIKTLYHAWLAALRWIESTAPFLRAVHQSRANPIQIPLSMWFMQKVLGFNRWAYWPVHFASTVVGANNVYVGVGAYPGYMPGCYIQGLGGIYVGDYTIMAPNVGIISANHDVHDSRAHMNVSPIRIGRYAWIGMNATILPGVELGDHTVVGAGSVVTRSFPEGYCVIAGNPARLVRHLDKSQCVEYQSQYEYHGYIPKADFEKFRRKRLKV